MRRRRVSNVELLNRCASAATHATGLADRQVGDPVAGRFVALGWNLHAAGIVGHQAATPVLCGQPGGDLVARAAPGAGGPPVQRSVCCLLFAHRGLFQGMLRCGCVGRDQVATVAVSPPCT